MPALVRALSDGLPAVAREAVHRGATSQDIIDTALMLLARRAIEVIDADLAAAADRAAALAERARGRRSWPAGRCSSRRCRSRSGWWRPDG